MTEIWKMVESYPLYEVSSAGRVKSNNPYNGRSTGRILAPALLAGYPAVKISYRGKTRMIKVHRLVATAFLPNPDNLPQVNHIDFDRTNNRVENLEWVTARGNIKHSYDAGRLKFGWVNGDKHPNAKLTIEKVKAAREIYNKGGVSIDKLAARYNVSFEGMRKALRGINWNHIK